MNRGATFHTLGVEVPMRSCLLALTLLVGWASSRPAEMVEATCRGQDPCRACKTCKHCKHCAKQGGICGECDR